MPGVVGVLNDSGLFVMLIANTQNNASYLKVFKCNAPPTKKDLKHFKCFVFLVKLEKLMHFHF